MKAASRWSLSLGIAVAVLTALSCRVPPPPDPNEATTAKKTSRADTLQRSLRQMSDEVNARRVKGEITEEEGREVLSRYAKRILGEAKVTDVEPADAWKLADVYRTAKDWPSAKKELDKAVKHATDTKNEDRRVNDSLRLAHVLAEMNEVKQAIKAARSVFDTDDGNKGPILLATMMEIVPAARGKGYDPELALLLEAAIRAHLQTIVDPKSDSGKAFIAVRWHHISNAWKIVIELYEAAGDLDRARDAALRAERMIYSHKRV